MFGSLFLDTTIKSTLFLFGSGDTFLDVEFGELGDGYHVFLVHRFCFLDEGFELFECAPCFGVGLLRSRQSIHFVRASPSTEMLILFVHGLARVDISNLKIWLSSLSI